MRHPRPAAATVVVLTLASASPAFAFSTQVMNNSNPDGSAKFVDPDEQLPFGNVIDGASGNSVYLFKAPGLGAAPDAAPGPAQADDADRGGAWNPERIRLLFGQLNPDAYRWSHGSTP